MPIPQVSDDGLFCQEVGNWTEEKHSLVSLYAKLFSTAMKQKWDERVYIELYAGAGYSKIEGTSRFIAGSPIRALALEDPFDKYIFCERDATQLDALKRRVERDFPNAKVSFIEGDCNQKVDDILAKIPPHSHGHRVLSLCFVDPFDIGVKFKTLQRLSKRFVDFLILLALYMDANRNYETYVKEEKIKINEFLDSTTWRGEWRSEQKKGVPLPRFLAESFSKSMSEKLSFQPQPFYKMKAIVIPEKNVRLYRLALFSRNPLAYTFWDQVLKYHTAQRSLWE